MDNMQLKCFISVAKTLNFSEAARKNFVSQSTVSRYIKDLEKEFGVKLFERTKRDVALTNEGKLLLPYVQEIIDTLNKANGVISQINNGGGGKLTVAYDEIASTFLIKCLKAFYKKYPEIYIDIHKIQNANEIILNSVDYDFYFMPRDLLPDHEKISSIQTNSDTLSFIVPSKMKLENSDIKKQSFVLLSENTSPILYMEIMDIFRTFHFSPENITTVDDIQSAFMKVQAEMGIGVLPTKLAESYNNKKVKVVDFNLADTDLSFVMAWTKSLANPVAPLFIKMAERLANSDEEEFVL